MIRRKFNNHGGGIRTLIKRHCKIVNTDNRRYTNNALFHTSSFTGAMM